MKKEQIYCLVGDDIASQLKEHTDVLSVTAAKQFLERLFQKKILSVHYTLLLGQGVSKADYQKLQVLIKDYCLQNKVLLKSFAEYQKVHERLTHQHYAENILIAEPIQLSDKHYQSALLMDERCDGLRDHLTGKHIPGMILTEAARQLVIAITEKFFIDEEKRGTVSFVTHRTDCEFIDFLFPTSIDIEYRIIELRRGLDNNMKVTAEISFHQQGHQAARILFTFSTLEKNYLQQKETALAEQRLAQCIEQEYRKQSSMDKVA